MTYEVTVGEQKHRVELVRDGKSWRCRLDGREFPLDVISTQNGVLSLLVEGRSYEVKQESTAQETNVVVGHSRFRASVRDPRSLRGARRAESETQGTKRIVAPMPGKVVRILAPVGAEIEAGQGVLVIEAMKMQNELKSPKKGTVKKISVSEGAPVEAGQPLAEVG